jgi:hypothetical protein
MRGRELLIDAINRRDVARVHSLVESGLDVNATDERGWTPLMWAARAGASEIVRLLLDAGADPTPRDEHGYDAENIVAWYGEYRMGAYTTESMEVRQMLRDAHREEERPADEE